MHRVRRQIINRQSIENVAATNNNLQKGVHLGANSISTEPLDQTHSFQKQDKNNNNEDTRNSVVNAKMAHILHTSNMNSKKQLRA